MWQCSRACWTTREPRLARNKMDANSKGAHTKKVDANFSKIMPENKSSWEQFSHDFSQGSIIPNILHSVRKRRNTRPPLPHHVAIPKSVQKRSCTPHCEGLPTTSHDPIPGIF